MELTRYWRIVSRRWWLVAGLLAVVTTVSVVFHDWSPPRTYSATFRLNVGMEPVPPIGAEYAYNPLDLWMSSEYLMDDLASAVRGADYARRVAAYLGEGGANLVGRFGTATEHRVLTVSVTWGDSEQLAGIVNAAIAVLDRDAGELVGPLGAARPVLRLIDPPVVVPVGAGLQDKLGIPIRMGLALIAGVAGAFLWDYLDPSVQDAAEVEAMGMPVLSQIPRHR